MLRSAYVNLGEVFASLGMIRAESFSRAGDEGLSMTLSYLSP